VPNARGVFELIHNVAAVIKAYAADLVGCAGEFQLFGVKRIIEFPLPLECSEPGEEAILTTVPTGYFSSQGIGTVALTVSYFFAAAIDAFLSAYFFVKRSTRPAVSISFCLPVKNGWQLEQISVRIELPLMVDRVSNVLPQAQCTVTTW